jgi:hypothetical protein
MLAGGETAACAGVIVGGASSACFDVHAVTANPIMTSAPQNAV